ncbi:MAG TPA: PleD family two-component system response regulator [Paracoccaceae bacterium]|nr:PleD family two-component system response regulator [Paracoccaceae bacterium]
MSGRVLVVDDTATNRVLLRAKLAGAYYTVLTAESGAEALAMAESAEPDLILLDVMMPDMDGFEVCRRLKASERLHHVPVVMVTALNAPEEKLRGLEAGADDFLTKPVSDVALFARARNLLRMKMMFDELRFRDSTTRDLGLEVLFAEGEGFGEAGGHVLFVADSEVRSVGWAAEMAQKLSVRASACASGRSALDLVTEDAPDGVVISQRIGAEEDGRRLVSALRSQPETRQAAIIFAVEGDDVEVAAQALDLGASDYVLAPIDSAELAARLRSQLRRKFLSDRLRLNLRNGLMLATVDPLTGLFNRRYAERHLETFVARSRLSGKPFASLMLDLDRFKEVNDCYGHAAGDEVLKEFARRLQDNVRSMDLVARLGGEEFFVAMPDVDEAIAMQVAERIRAAVARPAFRLLGGTVPLRVTVSIGVSLSRPGESDAAATLRRADAALYASKARGRNQVTSSAA